MNKSIAFVSLAITLLFAGSAALAQTPDPRFEFGATLSGAQEPTPAEAPSTPSPGVTTSANGTFKIHVLPDLSSLTFTLTVNQGTGVTASHLHCGKPGENGPVVVPLSPANPTGQDVNGVLAEGTITSENIDPGATACEALIGRPVRNIASLTAAAVLGLIYVNVHTVANPGGEIRGQVIVGVEPTAATPTPPTPTPAPY